MKEACGAEEVYGIDIHANALKIAQQHGIKVFCINLDQGQLPFKDQTFCLVSMCGLLEFLDNPDNVIAESHRVMRKGGFLLLHARNLANWANRLSLLLGFQPCGVRASSKIGGLELSLREEPLSSVKNHCAFTLKSSTRAFRAFKVLRL
jgi:SAM-dependent methyltransferase